VVTRIAALALLCAALATATPAIADPNNKSVTVLCRDADYADLHPMVCKGPFSLGPQAGHGGGGGLLSGILHGLGL
jgi:hypothetical protein